MQQQRGFAAPYVEDAGVVALPWVAGALHAAAARLRPRLMWRLRVFVALPLVAGWVVRGAWG